MSEVEDATSLPASPTPKPTPVAKVNGKSDASKSLGLSARLGGTGTGSSIGAIHSYEILMVLELCDQGSLWDGAEAGLFKLDEDTLNHKAVLETALDIAKAMLHLHRNHTIFVLAFAFTIFMQRMCIKSPELLTNGRMSKAGDVYAYGITLWELYTGGAPYKGTPKALLGHQVAQQGKRPAFPSSTPAEFKQLTQECWSKDAEDRPTMEHVVTRLRDMIKDSAGKPAPLIDSGCTLPPSVPSSSPSYTEPMERKGSGSDGSGYYPSEGVVSLRGNVGVAEETYDFGSALVGEAEKEALSIVDDHIRACWAPREQSGLELLDEVKHKQRILPTGCDSLDILLGGGLREGHYTEVVGESSTGKSQLCMQVAVTAALRDEDVIYLDLKRAAQLCQARALPGAQVDLMAILSHITVIKAHSIHDTMNALDAVFIHMERSQQSQALPHEQRTQGGGPAGPGPGGSRSAGLPGGSRSAGPGPVVAPVLGGRQRQQGHTLMMCLGRMLRHSACHYNLAVLGSNHMVSAGGFKGGREVEDDGDVQPGAGGYGAVQEACALN
eukprot:gene8020-1250_t